MRFLLGVLFLLATLPGQVTSYGTACGWNVMFFSGIKVGQTMKAHGTTSWIAATRPAGVVMGFSPMSYPILRWHQLTCFWYVYPTYLFPVTVSNGWFNQTLFHIPNNDKLVGLPLYFQFYHHSAWLPPPRQVEYSSGYKVVLMR